MTDPIPVGDDDLQAYLDGRLAPERAATVASYLAAHQDVADRVARYRAQRDALDAALQGKYDEPVPTRLRVATLVAARRRRRVALLTRVAAALLLMVASGMAGWYANAFVTEPASGGLRVLTADAEAAFRTFTVEIAHPVEVRADNHAHLVQWLSGRLDRAITVPDLAGRGFRLMGGRVLPSDGGAAALIMYDDDRGTRLTIYLQTMAADVTDLRYTESNGVQTFYRAEGGLAFAVSARTDRRRLLEVARDADAQLSRARLPT